MGVQTATGTISTLRLQTCICTPHHLQQTHDFALLITGHPTGLPQPPARPGKLKPWTLAPLEPQLLACRAG